MALIDVLEAKDIDQLEQVLLGALDRVNGTTLDASSKLNIPPRADKPL